MSISNWIAFITPLLVVAASYLFGIATKSTELKNPAAKERYDNLYVPFMDWLIHLPISWADPGHLRPEVRQGLLRILLDNAKYMGPDSGKLLLPFYEANSNLDSLDIDHNAHYLLTAPNEYRRLYFDMATALLAEGTNLASKLKLPDLPGTIAKQFDHDPQSRSL